MTKADSPLPSIACVILSGGQSRRFGANKAFAELDGRRMIDRLISRLERQSSGPIAVNASRKADYHLDAYPFLSDRYEGKIGPLAGIHAAICWADESGFDAVITTPVDTPLLPIDYVDRLTAAGAPSVAGYEARTHSAHGIWPTYLRKDLELAIESGVRAVHEWVSLAHIKTCVFPLQSGYNPFYNVNTKEDLAELLQG